MQTLSYSVDIVMCIDATGSMAGLIDTVKAHALRFEADVSRSLAAKGKSVDSLRVRVIAFRDFLVRSEDALQASEFFTLPRDGKAFHDFVGNVSARGGGGNGGESGLEALAFAMRSDWTKKGDRRRQLVVLWTDDRAHDLERTARLNPEGYPAGLPKSLSDLTDLWDGQGPMSHAAKRMILFAPEVEPWIEICGAWEQCVHYRSEAGKGLQDQDYSSILQAISNSI